MKKFLHFIILLSCTSLWGASSPQDSLVVPDKDGVKDEVIPPSAKYIENSPTDAHFNDLSEKDITKFLKDKNNRISNRFKIPDAIKGEVTFWFKIYAVYSIYHTVIYDKEKPENIYDVVDSRGLFKKGKSPVVIEVVTKQKIKKSVAAIKYAFDRLSQKPKGKFAANSLEAKLLSLWGRKKPSEWAALKRNIRYQTGQRDRIMQGIETAESFIPAMEEIFRRYSLPPDLVRIPLVESSFVTKAKSKASAVGVWQFLEKSAMEYLVVDKKSKIDERLSPIKSTYAAARMFQRNIRILGDLGLAIIAYNHGPRNLMKLRHKYSGDNLVELLKLKKNTPLGYASRNYYIEFLALLHAERYRDEIYGIPLKSSFPYNAISIIKMKKSISVFDVASNYNVSLFELKKFNPDIFDIKKRLPIGTRVVIPRKIEGSLVEWQLSNDRARSPADELGLFEEVDSLVF